VVEFWEVALICRLEALQEYSDAESGRMTRDGMCSRKLVSERVSMFLQHD